MAEMVHQEDVLNDAIFDEATEMVEDPLNKWCCLYQVLLLQDDFVNVITTWRARACILILSQFHSEINLIKML